MKLKNIGRFDTIDQFVAYKIEEYRKREKSFETLFEFMFSEEENIMAELTDGYRIKRVTYGQFKKDILASAPTLAKLLSDVPEGSMVGLYLSNSMEWIRIFWEIIVCGYRPLLMNMSLSDEILENMIQKHGIGAVISGGKQFSVKTVMAEDAVAISPEPMSVRSFGTEVLFMSSGTTGNVKLCAYTGENFFYQICDSANIIKQCPRMKEHYKGELKQLTLLPFYHVFGFIAVYLWFAFFSRTFVFLKDLNPATIQNTVKKHEVTHIFAVPMVWDKVFRAAQKKVRARGEKTYKKFNRAIKISNSLGALGESFAKRALGEVREGLFGDSIRFLISGGGAMDPAVFEFYNGIGYHLANGYGMTEIGITSVEKSNKQSVLNSASVGAPFGYTEYRRDESGELLVKGRTRAARILEGDEIRLTDYDEWFRTGDLVSVRDGRYYHEGRKDDLVIGASGENLNPTLLEPLLKVPNCDAVCLISGKDHEPVLLASVQGCFSQARICEVFDALARALADAKLDRSITNIRVTSDALMDADDIKVSRYKVRKKYLAGAFRMIDRERVSEHIDAVVSLLEAEVTACFATALERDADGIGADDHFFRDLGGTSLDYFMLLEILKNKYAVEITESAREKLFCVRAFCDYIKTAK
ncbi:MAG: non-ribosomal peptide synthetase [Clostridia bacterium]|nr:non-ribosomal peptide synthetase [Clostridia bacterium]